MSRSWSSGSTRRWRKLRLVILARDSYACRLQLPGVCVGAATHVHHVLGKAYGDDPRYLVAACEPCNLATGSPQKRADPPGRSMTQW